MENVSIEYKRELTDNIEKEVVAFLNTLGGQIYIGVEDDGNILGVTDPDKVSLAIIDRIKNNILPSTMGIFSVEIRGENKKYIVVTVAQGLEKPYYIRKFGMSPNGCYYRIGSQSSPMSENMIASLFTRRISRTLHNVVSPNQYLTFRQLKIFYEERGFDTSSEYFLRNLGLYTEDGKFNYAAYLLADNNGTSIKVARFKGTDKYEVLERNEYGRCCLIKSAYSVLDRMDVYNTTAVKITGEPEREERRLVDKTALREAILNAIIHNDYINGSYPVVEVYDDRIDVVSSGGLPIGLSKEEFFGGCSTPRNRELMRVFLDMDLCEQLGSGMKKILRVYPTSIFQISEHFIRVHFEYDKKALSMLKLEGKKEKDGGINGGINGGVSGGVNGGVNLSKTAQRILEYLSVNDNTTTTKITQELSLPKRTTERAIKELRDKNYIIRVGSDKTGYYKILKHN